MATVIDLENSQERQDRGIRKEFLNVHRVMDERFEEQRSYMDERFEKVDEQFQEQRSYMDERFQKVDEQFQKVDWRICAMEVLLKNAQATSSWHDILPLPDPEDGQRMPLGFPDKVAKFWHLQRPRNHHKLIYLLRFYNIHAWKSGMLEDSDDSESEGSSEPLPTLEQAVKAEPALALSRLAARLGLDYHSIRQNMAIKETLQEMRASKEARGAKRAQLSEGNKSDSAVMRSTKRAATKVSSEPKPTPPPDVPSPKSEVLYIHGVPVMLTTEEEALYYRQKSSPLTEQDQVIWANASLPSGPKVRDTCERLSFSSEATGSKKVPAQRPQEAAELPASRRSMSPPEKKLTKPSYPSTIPFSTTPSPYKRASKMKPHSAVASEDTDLPRS